MKHSFRKSGIFLMIFMVGLVYALKPARAADTNLINNPSVETASVSSSVPLNWQTDIWGSNSATFTYLNSGYNSGKSLYIKMSGRKSGDAKWYFNPIMVDPDADYVFSDNYMSSVQTSVVAMSQDELGNPTYFDVATVVPVAKTTWSQVNYTFHTLPNTKTISIFHLIAKNGWLQTDNYSLSKIEPTPLVDFVPNNSMELVSVPNSLLPESWVHDKWGNNKPVYEYANNGYEGARSVKLTMTNYKTGDAKWDFTPQPLERGKDYRFTARYKTNTFPQVVAHFIKDDGTEDFFGLPDPQPVGSDWQQYSDVFSVPQNVKAVSVFFFLARNGWVQTDDYHITPYNYTGFDKGRVTLTFDDGFEKNITTVLPVLDQYNFKVTLCNATQYIEGLPKQVTNIVTFANHGNEICSHTVTHPDLTTQNMTQIDSELSHSQSFLQSIVKQPIIDFASPFGAYNAAVNTEIKKYYQVHRTTDEGFNSKDNLDFYRLRVQNMQTSTPVAQFQAWVNKAKADKTWLILLYHVVDTAGLTQFDTNKSDFDKEMAWLSTSGITVERMDTAVAKLKSQTSN